MRQESKRQTSVHSKSNMLSIYEDLWCECDSRIVAAYCCVPYSKTHTMDCGRRRTRAANHHTLCALSLLVLHRYLCLNLIVCCRKCCHPPVRGRRAGAKWAGQTTSACHAAPKTEVIVESIRVFCRIGGCVTTADTRAPFSRRTISIQKHFD